jgi:RHS repeat-associated protein
VPVPWSVTTAGVWTYETGSYTVPPGIAYITFFGQIYQASGTTSARFDDGFIIVGTHYFHSDHLSTRLLTDSGGNTLGQQGHFPFGESWYARNTTTNWQFTSYQRDSESGNDYALARSYVNRLARFSSPDPAGLAAVDPSNPQSWNRYAYVMNNPLAFDDPTGLVCNGADQTMWDTLANGTGIFDQQDCTANGGTWSGGPGGSTGGDSGLGNGFLNGAGGGDPGNGFPGDPTPGCSPVFDSEDNASTNCPSGGSSGAGAIAGGSNQCLYVLANPCGRGGNSSGPANANPNSPKADPCEAEAQKADANAALAVQAAMIARQGLLSLDWGGPFQYHSC